MTSAFMRVMGEVGREGGIEGGRSGRVWRRRLGEYGFAGSGIRGLGVWGLGV